MPIRSAEADADATKSLGEPRLLLIACIALVVRQWRDSRREFERTRRRTCATTASPVPPRSNVAVTAIDSAIFSVIIRLASVCAFVQPLASLSIRSAITRCASMDSIVAWYQSLSITSPFRIAPLENEGQPEPTGCLV